MPRLLFCIVVTGLSIATAAAAWAEAGDHGPVILIGHSLGADAVIAVAQAPDRYNIPVALLVLFDDTAPHEMPGNVARAINFTRRFNLTGRGARGDDCVKDFMLHHHID